VTVWLRSFVSSSPCSASRCQEPRLTASARECHAGLLSLECISWPVNTMPGHGVHALRVDCLSRHWVVVQFMYSGVASAAQLHASLRRGVR
jgi:hypothetical protein